MKKLYLASSSPRRAALLGQMGVEFEKLLVKVDESQREAETVDNYVKRLAYEKALQGVNGLRQRKSFINSAVLGADTIVAVKDTCLLGKPRDQQHAIEMLTALANNTHKVFTAVAVLHAQTVKNGTPDNSNNDAIGCQICCVETQVIFGDISEDQIQAYCLTDEPYDKAGAYGIQGEAAAFVKRIEGSYSCVVGLPLYETRALLVSAGVITA